MTSTGAASARKSPAPAAWVPWGATHTTIGNLARRMRSTRSVTETLKPPGVSRRTMRTAEREASDDVITRVSACAETGSITPESSK